LFYLGFDHPLAQHGEISRAGRFCRALDGAAQKGEDGRKKAAILPGAMHWCP
jgi:hypothetical protein